MILERIEEEFKNALKQKDEIVVSSLRNLKAEIKNTEIDKRKTLTDEEVLQVVAKKIKQHKDSIESFKAGSRDDLVAIEQQQMEVLQKYLPKPLSEDEARELVKSVVKELNATASDFGRVMKEVMVKAKGAVDGKLASEIVKDELSKK